MAEQQTAAQRLRDRIENVTGHSGRIAGRSLSLRCPAHEDRSPSLSLTAISGQALVHCHGGCDIRDVLAALDLTMADLYDDRKGATYRYDSGRVVTRSYDRTGTKKFRQSGDKSTVELYHLARLRNATEGAIFLVEGEKDVHAIEALDGIATTAPQGAANFAKVDVEPLRGRHVTAIADQDEAGQKWAAAVAAKLTGVVAGLRFARARVGKDAADHIAAGHGLDDFEVIDPPNVSASEEKTPLRRLMLTPASAIRPRRVQWLWQDRIPLGEVSLTPGRGGIGKSTFHAWLIAQLSRGTLPGVHYGRPMASVIAATEDSWSRTIVPRLIAAGADLNLVYRVAVVTEETEAGRLLLPIDCDLLADAIRHHGRVAVVSLDPLLSTISASIDTHRNAEVRTALEPLARIADETGVGMLGNAHFNKSAGADPLSLITGSAAFGEVIRAAVGFARDPDADDGSFVLSQIKNNLGRLDLPSLRYAIRSIGIDTDDGPTEVGRFELLGESDRSVGDILATRSDASTEGGDEAVRWLLSYLADNGGEALAADGLKVAAKDGLSRDQIDRARKRAGVKSEKTGMDSGWMWRLDLTEDRAKTAKTAAPGEVRSSRSSARSSGDEEVADE